jgi:hypothetical protein
MTATLDARFVAIGLVLAATGCVGATRDPGPGGGPDLMMSIVVENQTRDPVVVYFGRLGSAAEPLGRVPAIGSRTFRLPATNVPGRKLELLATQGQALLDAGSRAGFYVTTPFDAGGAREVRWLIQEGRPVSPVAVR